MVLWTDLKMVYVHRRDLKVCVCLWLSLIVLRWPRAVDRLLKSSYCQMFLSALLPGPTQIPQVQPLSPTEWCGPWLSVQSPWPLSGVALDCQCSPLDPSVVWPLTVSAAPLNPVMKPPWLLSGVALVCQCSPSQLDFVCAAASGPRHDGTGVQEHHATGAHQLHAELPAGRCHCVWPWARIRS